MVLLSKTNISIYFRGLGWKTWSKLGETSQTYGFICFWVFFCFFYVFLGFWWNMLLIRCLGSKEGDDDFSLCCASKKISGERPGLEVYICYRAAEHTWRVWFHCQKTWKSEKFWKPLALFKGHRVFDHFARMAFLLVFIPLYKSQTST